MDDKQFYSALRAYATNKTPIDPKIVSWAKNWPDKAMGLALTTQSRIIESEPSIIECALNNNLDWSHIISYCNRVLRGRWMELEDALLNSNPKANAGKMVVYARDVIGGQWKECEKYIEDSASVVGYSRNVLKKRWLEKEHIIFKNPAIIFDYCLYVMRRFEECSRCKEGEKVLLEENYPDKERVLCDYAKYIACERWPEAEEYMIKTPASAYNYAHSVLDGRWPEAEPIIAKDPSYSIRYAQDVLKGAFPLAEKNILSSNYYFDYFTFATAATRELVAKIANQFDSSMTVGEILQKVNDGRNKDFENKLLNSTHNQKKAVWYAANILKGRWIEAENIIKRSARWSVTYARDVIGGRWEDAEKTIMKDPKYLADYGVEVIKGQLPIFLHNILIAERLKGQNPRIDKYFDILN
jgi:hypothetical protein